MYDKNDIATKDIVRNTLALSVADMLWPNYLNSPIRNTGKVNGDDFVAKMNKSLVKYDADTSEKIVHNTVSRRTQSKRATTPVVNNSQSIQSFFSESQEAPKVSMTWR